MKFRTEIDTPRFPPQARIDYTNRILCLGSCFADEMASRLQRHRFHCMANPTGALFNPVSLAATLHTFASDEPIRRDDLHEHEGLWHHFGFHGAFSDPDPDVARAKMQAARHKGAEALRAADRIILTLGTAWVYERQGEVVANCHRFPAQEFMRRRLSVEQVVRTLATTIEQTLPKRDIILTVSPVRHIGDGLEGNCVSKAILRVAAEELAGCSASVRYFPAYEILCDDLRDYRFYADDLTHPSAQAVEYVWEKFSRTALTDDSMGILDAVAQIVSAAAHRPLHPDTEAFRTFCRRQIAQIDALPQVDLSEERSIFEKYSE